MTVGEYAPPCTVHPDRYGAIKTQGDDLWFVLHTSEGGESTASAEALCSFMGSPGDRTTSSGGRYGSSYHVVFDTDLIRPAVPYNRVAYSAAGGNSRGRHGCFPGKAGQTRAQWLDQNSRAMIRQAAAWLVDCGIGWLFPTERLTVAQVQSREVHGLCDHDDISKAFGKSTHWDVGPEFPWDVLYDDIRQIVNSNPEPPPIPPVPPPPSGDPVTFTKTILLAPGPENRVLDSRWFGVENGRFGDARPDDQLNGVRRIPCPKAKGAKAITVNLVAVDIEGKGYFSLWKGQEDEKDPVGWVPPANSSKLNATSIWQPVPTPQGVQRFESFSINVANEVMVPVNADGSFMIYCSADSHCVIDLVAIHS